MVPNVTLPQIYISKIFSEVFPVNDVLGMGWGHVAQVVEWLTRLSSLVSLKALRSNPKTTKKKKKQQQKNPHTH
jgi:hypothetical protein